MTAQYTSGAISELFKRSPNLPSLWWRSLYVVFASILFSGCNNMSTPASTIECTNTVITSSCLTNAAFQHLYASDLETAEELAMRAIQMFSADADAQQNQLGIGVFPSEDDVNSYWALNDIGGAYFILGEVARKQERTQEAKESYCEIISRYPSAQSWDEKRNAYSVVQQMAGDGLRQMGLLPRECNE